MSIKDTIAAARQEAQDSGGILSRGRDADKGGANGKDAPSAKGRASAARAKPARGAASSVRMVSVADAKAGRSGKRSSEMTREERKAERASRRNEEDRLARATTILLERQEGYKHAHRVWFVLIGVGVALTVASFILTRAFPVTDVANARYAVASIIVLVAAYALIIGAFIYDWRKIKPMRVAANEAAGRLTNKQMKALLREDAERRSKK